MLDMLKDCCGLMMYVNYSMKLSSCMYVWVSECVFTSDRYKGNRKIDGRVD